jgi:hypothetical protein
MKRKFRLLFFVQLVCLGSIAQKPGEILNSWSGQSPLEKIHLHLDRDNYIAGETIWFKAYLYSDFLPDTISTTLYVELLDGYSTILSRKILPVLFGNTYGQFEIPDTLGTGSYFIRAYSPTILNHNPDFIYKRSVIIYGKKGNTGTVRPKEKIIRLEFFPESGNFISGMLNTIAFKATDENGLPVAANGVVKNEKDETVVEFNSLHDGMGMFDLSSKENEKYYAMINGDVSEKKYYLPEQTIKGIVFKIMPDPQGKYFEILQRITDPAFQANYMIGQMQHHVVFRQEFSPKEDITGIINTSKLSSGILQITVFNKDNLPLAERLSFIDNKEYIQPAELIPDTINFSEKAKNRFSIFLKNTVQGSLSISVTNPEYSLSQVRDENIFSSLLLTGDLKGYIHHPAWYFSSDDDSVKNALDLVMMINGWRRFKWTNLLKNPLPAGNYKDPAFITLSGKINIRDTKKPFANKPFVFFIVGPDSSRSMQMTSTNGQGYFKVDSLVFFNQSRIVFKDIRGKKSQLLEVMPAADSITRTYTLPGIENYPSMMNDTSVSKNLSKLAYDYNEILKASGIMLKGVIIKSRKKTPVEELEEKYASGLFSGFSERTIDLVNTDETINELNIFDYLQARVPGLSVINNGPDYIIYYRQVAPVSSMGAIPMTLYLDEIQTDANFISSIPANQVAMVKVFSSFVGAVGNGAGGALAIYTKKGADLYNSSSIQDQIRYQGYSLIKEFYSPDYTVDIKKKNETDHRITLQWIPDIIVNNINAKIPVVFYNDDRARQFKIVVEGMTTDGKMIFIEKTIPADKSKKAF